MSVVYFVAMQPTVVGVGCEGAVCVWAMYFELSKFDLECRNGSVGCVESVSELLEFSGEVRFRFAAVRLVMVV